MISINEETGLCKFEGTGIDLLSDLSIIVRILVEDTDLTPADIMGAVIIGLEKKETKEKEN